MSKRFIPVMFALLATGLFAAFQSNGGNDPKNDDPKTRYAKILRNVGILLEQGHVNPKKIDNDFSKAVLKKFQDDLDDEKAIFFRSDIRELSKFDSRIDDEIHGEELQSFYAVNELYQKRLIEVQALMPSLLSKPFDFSVKEFLVSNPEKATYPSNEAERTDTWRKRLKYFALSKFVDLSAARDTAKIKGDKVLGSKADSTLEREARDYVRKIIERTFTTRRTSETQDHNFSVFVNAIAGTMDPHTDYFAPVDLRSFNEEFRGTFYGIGALLKEEDGRIKIASLVTGMPAFNSGEVKENDEIIKIGQGKLDPVDVTGYSVQDAVKLIRASQKGTEVRLTLKKSDGSIKVVPLIRDEIVLDQTYARSAVINGAHKIGYIYLPDFYANFDDPKGRRCAADVAKEIQKLKAENVEGIIMDIRSNGGGALYEAVDMVGLFIEDGPVVQVKGRGDKANVIRDRDRGVLYSGPLTVMIDEFSASASEIFAAAIQDYKRGIVIGSGSSYGKGSVQRNIPLNPESENALLQTSKGEDLGALKLTLQKYYRINGGATQMKGVVSDLVLPDRYEFSKFREKNTPFALPYDEIKGAEFKPWVGFENINGVLNAAREEAKQNPQFNAIRTEVQYLSTKSERDISLNIADFRAEQKELRAVAKRLEDAGKLANPMKVDNIAADVAEMNRTKENADRNKQNLKRLSTDIYVDQSVKVLDRMIENDHTARAEAKRVE